MTLLRLLLMGWDKQLMKFKEYYYTKLKPILDEKLSYGYYFLKYLNWFKLFLIIITIQVIAFIFTWIHYHNPSTFNVNEGLQLILTVNGLFSAILITHFFNRISWVKDQKKDLIIESEKYSQKITDFRRICRVLTMYYNVWRDDESTKELLEYSIYKHIDYFDYKLESHSEYKSPDHKLIRALVNDDRHNEMSDLYLAMISLVKNRKDKYQIPDSELYGHYQRKGVYNFRFIEKCVSIEYASRMSYWFNERYSFIHYNRLRDTSKAEILEAACRIDKKYEGSELNDELMKNICEDMHEFYFKELYQNLKVLKQGINGNDRLVYIIITLSLIFGVLLPFLNYFMIQQESLKRMLTEILISVNIGLIFYLITNLGRLINEEITYGK